MSLLPPYRSPSRTQVRRARQLAEAFGAAAERAYDMLQPAVASTAPVDTGDCPAAHAALLEAAQALVALKEARERDPDLWRNLMGYFHVRAPLFGGSDFYDEAVRLYRIVCPDPEPLPVLAGITRAEGWAATELLAALSAGTLALVLLLGHRPQQELQTERAGGGARG